MWSRVVDVRPTIGGGEWKRTKNVRPPLAFPSDTETAITSYINNNSSTACTPVDAAARCEYAALISSLEDRDRIGIAELNHAAVGTRLCMLGRTQSNLWDSQVACSLCFQPSNYNRDAMLRA